VIGTGIRMRRLFRRDGLSFMAGMDASAIYGPQGWLAQPELFCKALSYGGVDALILTKGQISRHFDAVQPNVGIILRISGGYTSLRDLSSYEEMILSDPDTALSLGADAIIVNMKLGHENETQAIMNTSAAADACRRIGLPLIVEVTAEREGVPLRFDPEAMKISMRVAEDLGATVVVAGYTGSAESFEAVINTCSCPVIAILPERSPSPQEMINNIVNALKAGARGILLSRSLWTAEDPHKKVREISKLVHQRKRQK